MSVEERCNYFTSILIYKCLHNSSSNILSNRSTKASDSHCYITRYAENYNLQVPKPNSNYIKGILSYKGVVCWNSLPDEIKSSHTLIEFKNLCKSYYVKPTHCNL